MYAFTILPLPPLARTHCHIALIEGDSFVFLGLFILGGGEGVVNVCLVWHAVCIKKQGVTRRRLSLTRRRINLA